MAVTIQLKDFAVKASPTPSDIVYCADASNSFNEVQATIADLIGAYPALVSIGGLTTTANEFIYTTGADTYATAPITAFGISVLALSAATTAPTAGALVGWDTNKNLLANNVIEGYATTVTSASPIVLTVASPYAQYLTGSTAQTVTMPVTSTLAPVSSNFAQSWCIVNDSSATATINSSGGNLIVSLPAGSQSVVTCILNTGTTAASWSSDFIYNVAGVASVTGTSNRITSSGGATPVIDISAAYVGQSSITTLGTITAGIWHGTAIDLANYVSGNLSVNNLNSGTSASSTTYWRGDGTWDVPSISASSAAQSDMEAASSTTLYTSPGRQFYHPGHPKAWVNLTMITTTAIIVSYNITSVSDGGVGIVTVNVTNAFSTANYTVTCGTARSSGSWVQALSADAEIQSSSAVRFYTGISGGTDANNLYAAFSEIYHNEISL